MDVADSEEVEQLLKGEIPLSDPDDSSTGTGTLTSLYLRYMAKGLTPDLYTCLFFFPKLGFLHFFSS